MIEQTPDLYSATTRDIDVQVTPFYIEGESCPDDSIFVWGYRVTICNHRENPVQLRSRYWKITNGMGLSQEIEGEGVIGQQPVIEPGGRFQYTSGAPLSTPSGIMFGYYTMRDLKEQDTKDDVFDIHIPTFSLDSPYQKQTLN